jgi:hypothetical protein
MRPVGRLFGRIEVLQFGDQLLPQRRRNFGFKGSRAICSFLLAAT